MYLRHECGLAHARVAQQQDGHDRGVAHRCHGIAECARRGRSRPFCSAGGGGGGGGSDGGHGTVLDLSMPSSGTW